MADRTVTVTEAAQQLGITEKAVRRRIERGTLQSVIGHDGRRRIPVTELDGDPGASPGPRPADPGATPPGNPVGQTPRRPGAPGNAGQGGVPPAELAPIFARMEELAAENGRLRALTEVADSTTSAIELELHEARARIRELEAQQPRRRWWQRREPGGGEGH